MNIKKIIITSIIAIGLISGGTYFVLNNNSQKEKDTDKIVDTNKPNKDENKVPDNEPPVKDDDEKPDDVDDEKPPVTNVENKPSTGSNSQKPNKPSIPNKPTEEKPTAPVQPDKPVEPEKPTEPDKPVEPSEPEVIDNFKITNDMANGGVITLSNKKYNTLTVSSDIVKNVKITLDQVEVKNTLTLEKPGQYQLDIKNSKIAKMNISSQSVNTIAKFFKARSLFQMNKTLEGPTVNLDSVSGLQTINIDSNVEINGSTSIDSIKVDGGYEVVLNVPSNNVNLSTSGTVNINSEVKTLTNDGNASTININANIANFTNNSYSTIRLSKNSTITNFENRGLNTTVAGSGTITDAAIYANNTVIYTNVTNKPVLKEEIDNVLIRKENNISITDVHSTSQSSVTFTLSAPAVLTLKDISVICTGGKSISLFNLSTKDNTTYTLSTSYFKNNSYGLYITLPNGNIISEDFDTDYANPTVNKAVLERTADTKALLELYGVDEGGHLYYILEEALTKETISAEYIKEKGKSAPVKVGYNAIDITDLEQGKAYNLYYCIEGYFDNLSKVKGPFELSGDKVDESTAEYQVVYAKEELPNRFVFKLNKAPKKALTLNDFQIICPQESSLTTSGAKFTVSPDLLTYILVVPDNYGHKDNKYTVSIQISDSEKIESSFVSHFDPPSITGAVDNVSRPDENTAVLDFYSDEAGTVYYGTYEWNGAIYDYNSTTPFAADVITGAIASKQQKLNAGPNKLTVDLTGKTVTKNTRIWALFVDTAGNYRVGFVDHYKIPEFVKEPDPIENTVKITNFNVTGNKSFSIDFNETIGWVSSDDLQLSVIQNGSLPSKLLYSIDNDTPKHLGIEILNYTLPSGEYELTINTTDKDGKNVTIKKKFTIN